TGTQSVLSIAIRWLNRDQFDRTEPRSQRMQTQPPVRPRVNPHRGSTPAASSDPDWLPKIEKGTGRSPEPLLTWTFWSGRPDLNRRPLDPQNGGVGVFAARRHSACCTRRVATCGLFRQMHGVWSPDGPQGRTRSALLGAWADVGAAARDSEDQALLAEDLDRAQYGIPSDAML